MSVSMVWHGWPELEHALDKLVTDASAATETAMHTAADAVMAEARTGIHSKSGGLAGSFTVDGPTRDGEGWSAKVGPTAPHSRIIELGHHRMNPRRKPGSRPPHPYLKPGFERASLKIAQIFESAWRRA